MVEKIQEEKMEKYEDENRVELPQMLKDALDNFIKPENVDDYDADFIENAIKELDTYLSFCSENEWEKRLNVVLEYLSEAYEEEYDMEHDYEDSLKQIEEFKVELLTGLLKKRQYSE